MPRPPALDPAAAPATDAGLFCPQCDYNLTGLNVHRCPECGHAFDPISLAIRWRGGRSHAIAWDAWGGFWYFVDTWLTALV